MATYPKTLKPWRGFPNANVVHALALNVNQAPAVQNVYGQPGRNGVVLQKDVAFHVGTIPRGSIILPISGFVSTAFTATATLKLGSQTVPEGILATATLAPGTAGRKDNLAPGTLAAAVLAEDTPVFALLEVIAAAAGAMQLVIPFYIHRD